MRTMRLWRKRKVGRKCEVGLRKKEKKKKNRRKKRREEEVYERVQEEAACEGGLAEGRQ